MYSYLTDANDVFRDINVAELDKDTGQARLLLQRVNLDILMIISTCTTYGDGCYNCYIVAMCNCLVAEVFSLALAMRQYTTQNWVKCYTALLYLI